MTGRSKRQQRIAFPRGRFLTVLTVMGLMLTGLFARAVDLQILRKDFYQAEGEARHIRTVAMPASRGMILDRYGAPLAVSSPVESIWANPQVVLENAELIPALAGALRVNPESLARRIAERAEAGKEFVYLKRHVAPDFAAEVMRVAMPGVELKREYRRFYPSGEVAAHILGVTDIDDGGQEGLELAFNDWLAGEPGEKQVIKDRFGRIIENVELIEEPRPGRDLVTSIDRRLQYTAYRELKAAVLERGAKSGSAVVLDVNTGEVLAMVNQPAYNPNARDRSGSSMRNRAVTDFFEPGSVMKPFTVIAALESGRYGPRTPVDTSPGFLKVGQYTTRDFRDYGLLDVTGILTKSSNVGVAKVALNLDADHVWDTHRRFGFGSVTGSGFPGESPGILPHHSRWREVEKTALSRGYGLSTTPLQLAQAYAAIANDGKIRAPTFVKVQSDQVSNPDAAVIDPSVARQLVDMLETVIADEGTGTRARVSNYRVAGKTGTSRKASSGGYDDRYVASFAGMAPASQPRVVVVVSINDPATEEYGGGAVAAPVAGAILSSALRLMDVPPDDLLPGVNGQRELVAEVAQ